MSDEKQGTGDREWLYNEILAFIKAGPTYGRPGSQPPPKTDEMIYRHFCPMHGGGWMATRRDSWVGKKRHTKRAMVESALRRLVRDGRIKVEESHRLNLKSMHGIHRSNIDQRRRLLGKLFDEVVRVYTPINVLEGIVQALEDDDG